MNLLDVLYKKLPLIEEKIGYTFQNKELLITAFTHRSFVNENQRLLNVHNERLEFFGDAILGLITSDFLYHRLPTFPEGPLSQLRSRLVDAKACAHYLQKLELAEYILLGKGEAIHVGKVKMSILADCFEALMAAIFIDGGLHKAKEFFLAHFEKDMEAVIGTPSRNFKAELQDYSQKKFQQIPIYQVMNEKGPDHAKIFHVSVYINEKSIGEGSGESKKQAEQQAAFDALSKLEDHGSK